LLKGNQTCRRPLKEAGERSVDEFAEKENEVMLALLALRAKASKTLP
jgi:hypothetical protein